MLRINLTTQCLYLALTLVLSSLSYGQPVVPLNTGFSHWDHHWILWTPQHPVYEAVEVMTDGNPQSPKGTLVRVFFTERAREKRQVYYFNDAAVANRWRVGVAYQRDIEYQTEDQPGQPLALSLKFNDNDNRNVELSFEFDQEQRLTTEYAGLTDQMGHGSESVFLLFYREKTSVAARSRLVIGGEDYSIKREQPGGMQAFYRTGYRSNIYVATVSYGEFHFDWKDDTLTSSRGRVFKGTPDAKGDALYRSNQAADQTVVELLTNSHGELREYRHRLGEHALRLECEPAVPTIKTAKSGQKVKYRISIDNFKNLVQGDLLTKNDGNRMSFDWEHQFPDWTKNYRLRSTILATPAGYDLTVSRKQ